MINNSKLAVALSVCIYTACLLSMTIVEASSVVNLDREARHSRMENRNKESRPTVNNSVDESTKGKSDVARDVQVKESQHDVEKEEHKKIANDEQIDKEPLKDEKTEEKKGPETIKENPRFESTMDHDSSIPITSERYFDSFKETYNGVQTFFGDGGNLAGLSSVAGCSSHYFLMRNSSKESVSIGVDKFRSASFWGADTSFGMTGSFRLKEDVIISKKHIPAFEIKTKSETKIVDLKKISHYGKNKFTVSTGDVHFLDDIFVPNAKITLLLYIGNNKNIRIPIPNYVVEDWKKVSTADLRQMKYDYENQ